jgi:hypothetical protein
MYWYALAGLFMLLVQSNGQVFLAVDHGKVRLELYIADRTTLIAPLVNNMVIDLANTPSVNIKASVRRLQSLRVSSMSFIVDDEVISNDNDSPYWMFGDKDGGWTPTVGNHTVAVKAYRRNYGKGRKILETTMNVVVIDSRAKSPVAAPINAPFPAPVAVPMLVPVSAPMMAPVSALMTVPVSAPIAVPMMVPAKGPASMPASTPVSVPMAAPLAPMGAPARVPTMMPKAVTRPPTRSPTKSPSKAPTKAPINSCDLNTIVYINCITLSNRTLTLTGTTAEDRALQWLVVNDTLSLLPNSDANKIRLRQRFAVLSLGFQSATNTSWVLQNNQWNFSAVHECDWYNVKNYGFNCQNEKVARIHLYAMKGTLPPDLCWLTGLMGVSISYTDITGTLPSQLGWWTNLTTFDLYKGSVQGTIPSSIGAWTAIAYLSVASNKLSGTIPTSIGNWTGISHLNLAGNKLSGTVPSTVSAWTALQYAMFVSNNMSGTMPTFGGGYCPKTKSGSGVYLGADCLNNTGQAKMLCDCCNYCV